MNRSAAQPNQSEDHSLSSTSPPSDIVPVERKPSQPFNFENQSKFIQDRITSVEKNFGQLCETFSSYTRKTARLRDKGDQVSKDLMTHVDGEVLNPSAKEHFTNFAQQLSAIQDYRNAQVTRLETKVQVPLSNYGLKCKHAKADLKAAFAAKDKEQKLRKKLEAARKKGDTRQIASLETDLQHASVDSSRTTKNMEQQADKFELEKLQDAKKIFTDFVMIEMAFHAKALEVYSQCYKNLNEISIDKDIKEFRSKVRPSHTASRMNRMARAGSESSLGSAYEDTPRRDLQANNNSPQRRTPAKQMTNGMGNMLDDDEEESEEESGEEEEESEEESEEEESELDTDRPHQVQAVTPINKIGKR